MSSITVGSHEHVDVEHAHDHGHHAGFISTYIFSRDHKIIGVQFLFSTLIWFFIGGLLALGACSPMKADKSRPKLTRCCSPCTPR